MDENKAMVYDEIRMNAKSGWFMLILSVLLYAAAIGGTVVGGIIMDGGVRVALGVVIFVISMLYVCIGWIFWLGLKVIRPNEALVLTLFGKYIGSLRDEGYYYVNPLCVAVTQRCDVQPVQLEVTESKVGMSSVPLTKKLSLKVQTLDNSKQKINDEAGNPIEVGIIVTWRIVNTAKAVFNVDNFEKFISIQADSALRDVVRCYPYDAPDETVSLRRSSAEVSDVLETELQKRVEIAGIAIVEARITHLAYAPEIAAAMLQRQQATAIIEARQKIVDGAVGMVEMALNKLNENNICNLDEERKAQMVSNLLVVLCGNKDAQPIVNSGSIY